MSSLLRSLLDIYFAMHFDAGELEVDLRAKDVHDSECGSRNKG